MAGIENAEYVNLIGNNNDLLKNATPVRSGSRVSTPSTPRSDMTSNFAVYSRPGDTHEVGLPANPIRSNLPSNDTRPSATGLPGRERRSSVQSRNSFSSSVDPILIEKRQKHFRSGSNMSLRSNDSYHKVPLLLKDNDSILKKDGVPQVSVVTPDMNLPAAIEKTDFSINPTDSMRKPPLDSRSETKIIMTQPLADDIVKAKEEKKDPPPRKIEETIALKMLRKKPKDEAKPVKGKLTIKIKPTEISKKIF